MTTYIVAMSSQHDGPDLARRAIDNAKADGADLLVVTVVEPAVQSGLSDQLIEQSFVGVGPIREAAEQLKRTQLALATKRLQDIERRAREAGVEVQIDILDGDFEEQVQALAHSNRAERIYVYGQTQGKLGRLFFESEIDKVVEGARCEVVLVDDDA